MKPYKFSPIKNKEELFEAIKHTHFECYKLCKQSFGYYLPNAGNIGIFCHYDKEYDLLIKIRKELTEASDSFNGKYFRLHTPIIIPSIDDIPETTYTHLHIRKPDPYRHHVGDIDFYVEPNRYQELKESLLAGKKMRGARIFDRADLDMIELYNPDIDALAYLNTNKMTEMVKIQLSKTTKHLHELAQPIFTSDVYIMCGDEVLMFKRSETKKKFPNFWSIPGGHIDENEDPLACAIREVKEETGIHITPNDIKLKGVAIHHHLDRKEVYVAFAFVATLKEKITTFPASKEGTAHWVKKKDMMHKENVFPPIKYYFNHILNDHKGVMYDMSEWENSTLVRVLSESVDQNS